jgi:ArsR family transcriptional regulator
VKSPTAAADAPGVRGTHLRPKAKVKPAATPPGELSDQTVQDLTEVFGLLSDPSRLKILLALARAGELHVSALCEHLGSPTHPASQPAVSHHLTLLRMKGLVSYRREGKYNHYRLDPAGLGELLRRFFADAGESGRRIPFGDFVLSLDHAAE